MIQRATLMYLLKMENQAIKDYIIAVEKSDIEDQRREFIHILNEEKYHKEILERMLRKKVDVRGQKQITSLLSLE